jgi:hypothetical protein
MDNELSLSKDNSYNKKNSIIVYAIVKTISIELCNNKKKKTNCSMWSKS